ncbi:glycerophosphodiester phosphodiesterase [Alkalihalobacillus sp. MEB130]|uniref:glycerophosphodiester phosphodiesterase n=1 Tax=Alkalihalobacillus sp. MEB130 TaxID=2976704 RepID=UPI0028E04EBF|nr:glycerophosphodiester phosphodiesterase [Alkalihalobacillus sp. MEB130]MDT8862162.1 glycerophosphodiester phosphodiesterase [Alkalihalobacillus sp. MEB130]
MVTKPLIIAHRGASGVSPENTIASFLLGVKQGCEGIELDVQLSKDGEFVVIHDYSLYRTTNGTGYVNENNVSDLKKLDAGSWFHKKYAGERIPLLEEVFLHVPTNIILNLEIKYRSDRKGGDEEKLLKLVERYGRLDQVVFSSFNHKALYRLKQLNSHAKIGLLYASNLVNHVKLIKTFGLPCYSLHPHYQTIDLEDLIEAKQAGMNVFIWTVNEEEDVKKLIHPSVTGIITDYPGKVKQQIENFIT